MVYSFLNEIKLNLLSFISAEDLFSMRSIIIISSIVTATITTAVIIRSNSSVSFIKMLAVATYFFQKLTSSIAVCHCADVVKCYCTIVTVFPLLVYTIILYL